jgi:hypothetical protein
MENDNKLPSHEEIQQKMAGARSAARGSDMYVIEAMQYLASSIARLDSSIIKLSEETNSQAKKMLWLTLVIALLTAVMAFAVFVK